MKVFINRIKLPLIFFCSVFTLFLIVRISSKYPMWISEKAIELEFHDISDGKPISGLMIYLDWSKEIGGSFGGPGFKSIKEIWTMTDEFGRVYIPEFKSFHLISTFECLTLRESHPFYEGKIIRLYGVNENSLESEKNISTVKESAKTVLVVNLKSMKRKYLEGNCSATMLGSKYKINCIGDDQHIQLDNFLISEYFSEIKKTQKFNFYNPSVVVSESQYEEFIQNIGQEIFLRRK